MASLYEKYLALNLDGACIGLERRADESAYFCTPKGAKMIGWAGADGIHYCFARGFSEMVFVVSPMNAPSEYVYPVARSFKDFLRLLLVCGEAAALGDVYCWDQARFDDFLRDNPPTKEQRVVLDLIRDRLCLTPMESPFTYIKELQSEFDYGRIKYTDEREVSGPPEPKLPAWKVSFEGGFWSRHSREGAGKELVINRQFVWNDETWCVPSIYLCAKGLVMDFCVQIPAERIREFMDQWNLSEESDETEFSEEQQMQLQAENPLNVHFTPSILLNSIPMSFSHGSGMSWNPYCTEADGLEMKSVMRHYDLDPAYGWAIWRASFPWVKKRIAQIDSLTLSLKRELVAVPWTHFVVSSPGDQIMFKHPTTSLQYTLTVQKYEPQELPDGAFRESNFVFPTHYTALSYTLYPALTDAEFTVTDCVCSDPAKLKNSSPNGPNSCSSAAFGIIGSADGPTTILYGDNRSELHAACSALHFEPVRNVEWRMIFHEKRCEDISIILT